MNRENFRKKIDQLWKQLTTTVDQINRSDNDIVIRAEEILMETDTAIRQLKDILKQYQFSDWSDEIFFFKKTKPQFVAVYIYYSKVLAIEASKPYADPHALQAYYEKERANLLYFYNEQKEFNQLSFDWATDTRDGGDHVNLNGSKKICTDFGKRVSERYSLTDHRNDSEYTEWEERYKSLGLYQ